MDLLILSSSDQLFFLFYKTSSLNKEVSCTELSPSVRVPCTDLCFVTGGYDSGDRIEGYKKDKFPNYLTHIPPEDDPLATRTLFAGNLEINITEQEMRKIFGRYGNLIDVDIKRPPIGLGLESITLTFFLWTGNGPA